MAAKGFTFTRISHAISCCDVAFVTMRGRRRYVLLVFSFDTGIQMYILFRFVLFRFVFVFLSSDNDPEETDSNCKAQVHST